MVSVKKAAAGYVAAMRRAALATRPLIDEIGEGEQSLPHSIRGGSVERELSFLGGELVFADREGQQFALQLGLDQVDLFSRVRRLNNYLEGEEPNDH